MDCHILTVVKSTYEDTQKHEGRTNSRITGYPVSELRKLSRGVSRKIPTSIHQYLSSRTVRSSRSSYQRLGIGSRDDDDDA